MIIVRCPTCIRRSRQSYGVHAEPLGYPKTDIVCGFPGCEAPGLVWLNGPSAIEYTQHGRTCFTLGRDSQWLVKVSVRPVPRVGAAWQAVDAPW